MSYIPNGEFELSCDGWCAVAPSSERIGERDFTSKRFDPSCSFSGRKVLGELLGLVGLDRQRPQHLGLVPRHGRVQPVGKAEIGHPKLQFLLLMTCASVLYLFLCWANCKGLAMDNSVNENRRKISDLRSEMGRVEAAMRAEIARDHDCS